jgi:ubiquinone/menaquinone biosynthesis C-methylase UbiE
MESELWNPFSKDYDKKVFSLTRIPQRRKQILERISIGKILNLGCGPTPYLNQDLIAQENHVIATDFCQSMLDEAKKTFSNPNIKYVLADSRNLPFKDLEFDSVISVNSILPQEREDVYKIGSEVNRVLGKGGIFVAFLCSYDSVKRANQNLGLAIQCDDNQIRAMDTTGWQCFHTPNSISDLMRRAGFSSYNFKKVFLKTKQEKQELRRLYGADTSKSFIYEYLLVARK